MRAASAFVERLVGEGRKVFLDLKLHDIPHTVERATAQVARLGATFLTVHAYPQTMKAALAGAAGSEAHAARCDGADLDERQGPLEAGYGSGVETTVVLARARRGHAACMGLILSPHELAMVRAAIGPSMLLVTPGIRPRGAARATRSAS